MNPILPESAQQGLVLASASPRRRELLAGLGFEFEVLPSSYEEANGSDGDPAETASRHALGKAREVASRRPGHLVIGADTVVAAGELLGKPRDAAAAASMLRRLSGREHEVITALALVQDEREAQRISRSSVRFRLLDEGEITRYVASGEPLDKAGAYGIQGLAAQFITGIKGCYFNVMGLPLELLTRMLMDWSRKEEAP